MPIKKIITYLIFSFSSNPLFAWGMFPDSDDDEIVATAKGTRHQPSPQTIAQCQQVFGSAVPQLQTLYASLTPLEKEAVDREFPKLKHLAAEQCAKFKTARELLHTIKSLLFEHKGRIGVILPLQDQRSRHILSGFDEFLRQQNLRPQDVLIVKDSSQGSAASLAGALILKDRVSVIIGGFTAQEAQTLKDLAPSLQTPIFLLREADNSLDAKPLPNIYYSYPSKRDLGWRLAAHSKKRGFQKVAILKPSTVEGEQLVQHLAIALQKYGVGIQHIAPYQSEQFVSLEQAIYKIFPKDSRYPHSAPRIQIQALIVPDTARMVRHIAKLLKFHGVENLPLIGHWAWRDAHLVSPPEPLLAGSFFGDFMGSYNNGSGEAVQAQNYKYLGYKAIQVPLKLSKNVEMPRKKLNQLVPLTTRPFGLGGEGEVGAFHSGDHSIVWPVHIFNVHENRITPSS